MVQPERYFQHNIAITMITGKWWAQMPGWVGLLRKSFKSSARAGDEFLSFLEVSISSRHSPGVADAEWLRGFEGFSGAQQ